MTVNIQSQVFNPVTGTFGTGQIAWFSTSGTWTVPAGIGKCRVRVWGAGGSATTGGGAGGGFAIKTIYDLSGVSSVAVTVGTPTASTTGGTSSFGSYVSATGGSNTTAGGTGVGGDINNTGGTGPNTANCGGGGAASYFGNGGNGSATSGANGGGSSGGAGGGSGTTASLSGGSGFLSTGSVGIVTNGPAIPSTNSMNGLFSIDFIGCGGGGNNSAPGTNGGGGGGGGQTGTFPGGGGGATALGASGLVIVEY